MNSEYQKVANKEQELLPSYESTKPQNNQKRNYLFTILILFAVILGISHLFDFGSIGFSGCHNRMNLQGSLPVQFESKVFPIDHFGKAFGIKCTGLAVCNTTITYGSTASYQYTIASNLELQEDTVKFNYNTASNIIEIESPTNETKNRKTDVRLTIVLPKKHFKFDMNADIAELKWHGKKSMEKLPKRLKSFTTDIKIGYVKVENLRAKNVDITVDSGAIYGDMHSYESCRLNVRLGGINIDLTPKEKAETVIGIETGELKATVSKFKGSFDFTTKMGSLEVKGATEVAEERVGWMGKHMKGSLNAGAGTIDASMKMGNIEMQFQ
jgi:hypothetical protein